MGRTSFHLAEETYVCGSKLKGKSYERVPSLCEKDMSKWETNSFLWTTWDVGSQCNRRFTLKQGIWLESIFHFINKAFSKCSDVLIHTAETSVRASDSHTCRINHHWLPLGEAKLSLTVSQQRNWQMMITVCVFIALLSIICVYSMLLCMVIIISFTWITVVCEHSHWG